LMSLTAHLFAGAHTLDPSSPTRSLSPKRFARGFTWIYLDPSTIGVAGYPVRPQTISKVNLPDRTGIQYSHSPLNPAITLPQADLGAEVEAVICRVTVIMMSERYRAISRRSQSVTRGCKGYSGSLPEAWRGAGFRTVEDSGDVHRGRVSAVQANDWWVDGSDSD
jgi:hypothetical protein